MPVPGAIGAIAFAGVQADSYRHPVALRSLRDCLSAPDRPGGTVESREDPLRIALGIGTAEALGFFGDDRMKAIGVGDRQSRDVPPAHAHAEDRRQHLSRFGARPSLGQESLDVVEKGILVADEREMVVAGQLHEVRAGDQAGDVAALLDEQRRSPARCMTSVGTGSSAGRGGRRSRRSSA